MSMSTLIMLVKSKLKVSSVDFTLMKQTEHRNSPINYQSIRYLWLSFKVTCSNTETVLRFVLKRLEI